MLYKFHTNILIVVFLTIGFMAVKVNDKAFSMMTLGAVVCFVTQLSLLIYFSREKEVIYSTKTLFWVVLFYNICMGVFLMGISYYYDGDTFMFSKSDAMWYYEHSMRFADLGPEKGIKYITRIAAYDDWGALILDGFLMYMIPSKFVLNVVYMLLGACSSVFLFKIGRNYMPDAYAFLAVIGYSTSSFMLFFNCTFLKEPAFVFFVICAVYFQYLFITNNSRFSLLGVFFCVVIMLFFRPAVAAMLVVSIFIYYGIVLKKRAISIFIYAAAIIIFAVALKSLQEIVERNTLGGDIDAVVADSNNAAYSSSFNYFMSFFAAFLGPFPALFNPSEGKPTTMVFLGAGLSYRLFLMFPFWYGVFIAFKDRVIELLPMFVFIFLEMLATGYVCASLELRKVILHVPFMYIISFYGLSRWCRPTQVIRLSTYLNFTFAVLVLFLWNVIRVKNV